MKVSVVVPSYNSRDGVELCLLSLGHAELDGEHSFEVIVADDGSSDGTGDLVADFAAPYELNYVFLPRTVNSGRAAARNAGINAARGDLVVMIDADQIVSPNLLAEHIRYHQIRPDLVVVGARAELGDGDIDRELLAREFTPAALPPVAGGDSRVAVLGEFSANLNNLATCWHYLYSCNASVRREHVLAVGGFDEAFAGWGLEDTELGYRLRRRGLAFAFNAAALVYHQRKQQITARMYQEWRRNLKRFVRKYPDAPDVAIQSIVGDASIEWDECMRRFEYAARALHGRLPRSVTFELLDVDEENACEAIECLRRRAATDEFLVLDHTPNAQLASVVQCVDTDRELLYFHRPSPQERASILERYRVGGKM